jgi:carbonic anhydrase
LFALVAVSSVVAHPVHQPREITIIGREQSIRLPRQDASDFEVLSTGNKAFKDNIASTNPDLLQKLADDGQAPPFMFLGCSDSRVNEGTVFNSAPGTFFSQRNIANQFQPNDPNAQAVLSYAVSVLGVNHVIVMGHYGCGGVAAAIASAPTSGIDAASGTVQAWIRPIRELFETSSRAEIVELRTKNAATGGVIEEPEIREPGFRALVEENVKATVARVAADSVITNHYALLQAGNATVERRSGPVGPPTDVFIHGWVYDIETGVVADLGISVGPPGKTVPPAPFEVVAASAAKTAASHDTAAPAPAATTAPEPTPAPATPPADVTPVKRCEQLCKVKRSLAGMLHWQ